MPVPTDEGLNGGQLTSCATHDINYSRDTLLAPFQEPQEEHLAQDMACGGLTGKRPPDCAVRHNVSPPSLRGVGPLRNADGPRMDEGQEGDALDHLG